jgi:hypothetical protein
MYSLKRPHRAGHHLVERAPWVCISEVSLSSHQMTVRHLWLF